MSEKLFAAYGDMLLQSVLAGPQPAQFEPLNDLDCVNGLPVQIGTPCSREARELLLIGPQRAQQPQDREAQEGDRVWSGWARRIR